MAVLTCFLLALFGCGGSGGSSGAGSNIPADSDTVGVTISGVVSKGIIKNGTVHIYAINAEGKKGSLLATVSTNEIGAYTATLGDYVGPVLLEASGSYADEATGAVKTILPDTPLRGALADVRGNALLSVTPLTELAVLISEPELTPANILSSNALITKVFGFNVILTTPLEADAVMLSQAQTLDQQRYTLALASISQMAHEAGKTLPVLLSEIKADLMTHKTLTTTRSSYSAAAETYLRNHPGMEQVIMKAAAPFVNARNGTVVILNDGTLWTCGTNSTFIRLAPEHSGFIAAEKGSNSILALKSDGTVSRISFSGSSSRMNITDVVAVAATFGGGFYLSQDYILKSDGTVWALYPEPAQVSGLAGIVDIAGGYDHMTALRNDGTVWTWGRNQYGQLGDGTTIDSISPIQVPGLSGMIAVAAGGDGGSGSYTLALRSDGTVWGWGNNTNGQLGDGTNSKKLSPVKAEGLAGIVAIVAGKYTSYAIKNDGSVWSTDISYLAPGKGAGTPYLFYPSEISGLTGISSISSGNRGVTFASKNDGTVWSWGSNLDGQLGNGQGSGYFMPISQHFLSISLSGDRPGLISLPSNGDFSLSIDGTSSKDVALLVPSGLIKIIASLNEDSAISWSGCDTTNGNDCVVTMNAARNITARLSLKKLNVTSLSLGNGTIAPDSIVANYGESAVFTITPAAGYTLKKLIDNGNDVTSGTTFDDTAGTYTYQLSNIRTDHRIEAEFEITQAI